MNKATRNPNKRRTGRTSNVDPDDVLPEYDFSKGKPNPYATLVRGNVTLVTLDPDVAAAFPSSASVNHALGALAEIIHEHAPPPRRKTSRSKAR